MADLRTRFIEDYAGGLLNVARQELSSTGEVLAQDGFSEDLTLFVEDGRGVKSGLRLGAGLVECIDPATETGVLNVRTADRTYASIRDLKVFATAMASAQAALSESVGDGFGNLEQAFEALETDLDRVEAELIVRLESLSADLSVSGNELQEKVSALEELVRDSGPGLEEESRDLEIEVSTGVLSVSGSGSVKEIDINFPPYFGLFYISADAACWVTVYSSAILRASDVRSEPGPGDGIIADVEIDSQTPRVNFLPGILGYSDQGKIYVRVVNMSGGSRQINVKLGYIRL